MERIICVQYQKDIMKMFYLSLLVHFCFPGCFTIKIIVNLLPILSLVLKKLLSIFFLTSSC